MMSPLVEGIIVVIFMVSLVASAIVILPNNWILGAGLLAVVVYLAYVLYPYYKVKK